MGDNYLFEIKEGEVGGGWVGGKRRVRVWGVEEGERVRVWG